MAGFSSLVLNIKFCLPPYLHFEQCVTHEHSCLNEKRIRNYFLQIQRRNGLFHHCQKQDFIFFPISKVGFQVSPAYPTLSSIWTFLPSVLFLKILLYLLLACHHYHKIIKFAFKNNFRKANVLKWQVIQSCQGWLVSMTASRESLPKSCFCPTFGP